MRVFRRNLPTACGAIGRRFEGTGVMDGSAGFSAEAGAVDKMRTTDAGDDGGQGELALADAPDTASGQPAPGSAPGSAAVDKELFGSYDSTGYRRVNGRGRSEEHTSELQSLMRISYA